MAKKVVVTAGPTREAIDPVRFLGNNSSGKQGAAIANCFARHGYDVHLILGPVDSAVRASLGDMEIRDVITGQEMFAAAMEHLDVDVAIFAAAVADFRPAFVRTSKIKKGTDISMNSIEFVENPDILATVGRSPARPRVVVGFAAETDNLIENARQKLARKGADLIVVNDVSGGAVFGSDKNTVSFVFPDRVAALAESSKEAVAEAIYKAVEQMI